MQSLDVFEGYVIQRGDSELPTMRLRISKINELNREQERQVGRKREEGGQPSSKRKDIWLWHITFFLLLWTACTFLLSRFNSDRSWSIKVPLLTPTVLPSFTGAGATQPHLLRAGHSKRGGLAGCWGIAKCQECFPAPTPRRRAKPQPTAAKARSRR